MNVWIPWDADESEIQQRMTIREQIPKELYAPIQAWAIKHVGRDAYGWTSGDRIHMLCSAVQFPFLDGTIRADNRMKADFFVESAAALGDDWLLRLVDFLLHESEYYSNSYPNSVENLIWHLDHTGSAVEVARVDGAYRLSNRLVSGVEEAGLVATEAAPGVAGRHLSAAWDAIRALDPDTGKAMTEAMKAAEVAVASVVAPKDDRLRMAKYVNRLKDKQDWDLVLDQRDDGHPDHHSLVIGALETLALAQQNRHGGEDPTFGQAQAHVMLASLIVGWFSTGSIDFHDKSQPSDSDSA
ncbi:hypothetical protein [Leucobacter luti]|uniref:hypothetical protein n=1 Tax=Leucobacter luti TaxID=340320 RepID=UPI001C68F425|nr:hypothetical protein [Leucobacter luti]QYM76930.1 hypothetical protein K1X41_06010 [Leucobacter luti]